MQSPGEPQPSQIAEAIGISITPEIHMPRAIDHRTDRLPPVVAVGKRDALNEITAGKSEESGMKPGKQPDDIGTEKSGFTGAGRQWKHLNKGKVELCGRSGG